MATDIEKIQQIKLLRADLARAEKAGLIDSPREPRDHLAYRVDEKMVDMTIARYELLSDYLAKTYPDLRICLSRDVTTTHIKLYSS